MLFSNLTNNLSYALAYANRGWRVLPVHCMRHGACSCNRPNCKDKGKHPMTQHGCKDATTNEGQIKEWWKHNADANIGIATGIDSNLVVIDEDNLHTLPAMEEGFGKLPETLTAKSGKDGRHRYFKYPIGSGLTVGQDILPGLDYRGEGGYIIAAPSNHHSGGKYEWKNDLPLADCPDWLIKLLQQKKQKQPADKVHEPLKFTVEEPEDLINHPGVSSGSRNGTLCRLVGKHSMRGDSIQSVEGLALSWNRRCNPPQDERKVLQTVRGLFAVNDAKKQHEQPAIPPVQPTILPTILPTVAATAATQPVLDELALYGLAGDIVKAITPETEADEAGLLLSLLTCFGCAVGKGSYFHVGSETHYCNLYSCLYGGTGVGKGGTWATAHNIMDRAMPGWAEVSYSLASGEGLISLVADDESTDKMKMMVQPEKRLLCFEEEFHNPVKAMRREGSTLSGVIRAAFGANKLQVNTRSNRLQATNAFISLLCHCTKEELISLLSGRNAIDIANGIVNRFLWCYVERKRLIPCPKNADYLVPFVAPMKQAITKARGIGEVKRNHDAEQLWIEYYEALAEEKQGAFGKATARARVLVMRLAMIYALLDGSAIITSHHLTAALKLWQYCEDSARLLFDNGNVLSPLATKLLNLITGEGISKTSLHEATGKNYSANEISTALSDLLNRGLAHGRKESTGGRPSEKWYPGTALASVVCTSKAPSLTPTPTEESTPTTVYDFMALVKEQGGHFEYDSDKRFTYIVGCDTTEVMKSCLDKFGEEIGEIMSEMYLAEIRAM